MGQPFEAPPGLVIHRAVPLDGQPGMLTCSCGRVFPAAPWAVCPDGVAPALRGLDVGALIEETEILGGNDDGSTTEGTD